MFGLALIFILIIMGGVIAFFGDRIGTRVGKRRMTLWGLRPRYTSIIVTIVTGVLIAGLTLGILTLSSYDVRTALFGMEALKRQTEELAVAVRQRTQDLEKAHLELDQKTQEYAQTNQRIADLNRQLQRLRSDKQGLDNRIADLNTEKNNLQQDIDRLNEMTVNLRKGIEVIREGTVVVRAGEAIFSGMIQGGRSRTEIDAQVSLFLYEANQRLLERFGVKDKELIVLFLPKADIEELIAFLSSRSESIGLRLLSVGNVIAGEPVVGQVEVFPNRLIFQKGSVIFSEYVNYAGNSQEAEQTLAIFLRKVNEAAASQGILRDPLQGTVGNLSTEKYYEAVNHLRRLSGRVEIVATAKQDTFSAGPVQIELILRQAQ